MIPTDETPSPSRKADELFMHVDALLSAYWTDPSDGKIDGLGYRLTLARLVERLVERADEFGAPTPPSPLWIRTRTLQEVRTLILEVMEHET